MRKRVVKIFVANASDTSNALPQYHVRDSCTLNLRGIIQEMSMSEIENLPAAPAHNLLSDEFRGSGAWATVGTDWLRQYSVAGQFVMDGKPTQARQAYEQLRKEFRAPELLAAVENDLATMAAMNGEIDLARRGYDAALQIDPNFVAARENLSRLPSDHRTPNEARKTAVTVTPLALRKTKIAIVSILFNWPSTGGGTIHTAETGKFLDLAGYEVRHFFCRFADWGIGRMDLPPLAPSMAIEFDAKSWTASEIQRRFRTAVDEFAPDFVIVTDSWNFKPLLAEAMYGYRYFLRLAAQECLCPLNNVRLLVDDQGRFSSCPRHQLATPDICRKCVQDRHLQSGSLHQAERSLSGYGTAEYDQRLRAAFAGAEAVLAVNPLIAAMVSPYAKQVRVVPSGFDASRFPDSNVPPHDGETKPRRTTLLFAGLTDEFMKGFHVLRAACHVLWQKRRDFELVVTGDAPREVDEFCRYIGWQSQEQLPDAIRASDILMFPTIAEEALGRSAVEAMGAGKPVIASRIGGLQFSVGDGATGLLFEPGNVADLVQKLETLLDNPEMRKRMGMAGRQRFEADYTWNVIISRYYVSLLGPPSREYSLIDVERFRIAVDEKIQLGCVLAIRNRPLQVLERTLQTYASQSVQPLDRVLLDYGSEPSKVAAYRKVCLRYCWRLVEVTPDESTWSLSAAYNMAVAALDPKINLVFKGDVDVLIGPEVLATATRLGKKGLCIFSCLTTTAEADYHVDFSSPNAIRELCLQQPIPIEMDGEGIHAYPRRWFEAIGGFDLNFGTWGFEDSDLRLRATWSIGVERPTEPLLVHQWHPRNQVNGRIRQNHEYYESTKSKRQLVRNGGRMVPQGVNSKLPIAATSQHAISIRQSTPATRKMRIAIATRSMYADLYRLSSEFLNFAGIDSVIQYEIGHYRIVDSDAYGYFRELLELDADWVVNIDEDAFLLAPNALLDLIYLMDQRGYAACGMPDGGVVPIRRHNPVACNAFFNVFDMRRVRKVWNNWQRAVNSSWRPEYEQFVPSFANRGERAFDRFEPYYGLFFSLIEASESILYLDAEEWSDGVSTLLKSPEGRDLVLHGWYAREWQTDSLTQVRYQELINSARIFREKQN